MMKSKDDDKKIHEKRLVNIVKVIEGLDSIRKGKIHPQDKLVRDLSSLGGFGSELRYVKKDFGQAEIVLKHGPNKKLNRMIKISNIIQMICLQYFVLIVGLSFVWRLNLNMLRGFQVLLNFPIMLAFSALAVVFIVFKIYINKKIRALTEERSQSKRRDVRLKEMTQKFINLFDREIKIFRDDPKRYPFRVYHTDYNRIRIVKVGLSRWIIRLRSVIRRSPEDRKWAIIPGK